LGDKLTEARVLADFVKELVRLLYFAESELREADLD